MRYLIATIIAGILTVAAAPAGAQPVSFFGPGVVAFAPEVRVVDSGTLLDAQVTVSADRRYVTLTARPTVTNLIALERFPVAPPAAGFVGGVRPAGGQGVNPITADSPIRSSPGEILQVNRPTILNQRGMNRLNE